VARAWRSFVAAAWLSWQIESNWTQPLLFALYSIVKPLALTGILVAMYAAVAHGNFGTPVFTYMYIGNAFYLYVGAVMTGMAFAVIDDRERYQTLKFMSMAPIDLRAYLVGRGVARIGTSSVSVAIALLLAVFVLHMPLDLHAVQWPLFAAAFSVGLVMLAALGLILAATVLLLAHQSWLIGDAVAGSLFLFSGAIFPISVLPASLRPIAYAMPLTYWLELLRRAIVPPVAQAFPLLPSVSNAALMALFTLMTIALGAVAISVFEVCNWFARERGYLDRTTGY